MFLSKVFVTGLYDDGLKTHYEYIGGLYMASNVSDSCRVWNCKVTNPEEIVGPLGDLEHMASYLGEGETLQAGINNLLVYFHEVFDSVD